jgi:hypothetical protein
MSNKKTWERAKTVLQRLIDDRVEIYEVTRIFNPMANGARKTLCLCKPSVTDNDLDEVEKTIERYKNTLSEVSSTRVEQRVKRSMFFKTLQEHYDKNKNKRAVRKGH